MNIVISETTRQLLEERMKKGNFSTPDDALRVALETMDQLETEDLDDSTLAAIEEGLAQSNRGEGRPWEEVRGELRTRYGVK